MRDATFRRDGRFLSIHPVRGWGRIPECSHQSAVRYPYHACAEGRIGKRRENRIAAKYLVNSPEISLLIKGAYDTYKRSTEYTGRTHL